MKKIIFMLLLAASVATVAVVACDSAKVTETITEFSKGQADAKAFCDCMKSTSGLQQILCISKLTEADKLDFDETDPTKWSNYQNGVVAAFVGTDCSLEDIVGLSNK